jgi:hypothetical protein
MKKSLILSISFLLISFSVRATEGMWIPSLIDIFYSDMKTYGLKLKKEDIYSTNKSSLKDAIVQFDGGCTAEIVSGEGLLLTNHHCGYDAIQKHSSLENDYLKNGFWAKNKSEELACPWMYVTFVKEIRDVTKDVFSGVTEDMTAAQRNKFINLNIAALEKKEAKTENIKAKIKPFNQGNQYFMLVTEDFRDIRLVGTPPNAIGKFGGDTDNWVWPRHTGDFAVFRIYANKENKAAAYSKDNIPFKPAHFLPISVKPRKEGDFTMVYGFPGRTDQHYSSEKIKFYQELERPARIAMRTATMDQMKPAMNNSDAVRIKYSSKQASIANAWKKWIGQIGGLKALDAVAKKQEWEKEYNNKAASNVEWNSKYGTVINEMNRLTKEMGKYEFARAMFVEYFYYGPEFINFSFSFYNLCYNYEELEKEGKLKSEASKLSEFAEAFFKDYDAGLDHKIFKATSPLYFKYLDMALMPANNIVKNWEKDGENIYKNSVLLQPEKLKNLLANFNKENAELLKKDPAMGYASEIYTLYANSIASGFTEYTSEESRLLQLYVEGLLTMFPKKRNWADANSTLRIAYGKIEGSAPHDGMKYTHFTTIDGIMQKYDPANPDFELTQRFIDLYNKKDFGNYTQDGKLWVCFTASNHTTGGNSGSPVIDARGNLLGINFDRSWESTMSDYVFDPSRCRNIVVDARYVLWVIEKYGEAGHLLKEMKIVK